MANFLVFSERIKELRSKMGMTQVKFAEFIGCTSTTLSSYENNLKRPSLDIVLDIAERCTVSMDWLCGLSDVMDPGDKLRTYSDIIRHILKISDAITVHVIGEEINPIMYSTGIGFEDETMKDFFTEWNKMKDLYCSKIIDDDVYKLWIEKTLAKYDSKIQPYDFMNIPNEIDE